MYPRVAPLPSQYSWTKSVKEQNGSSSTYKWWLGVGHRWSSHSPSYIVFSSHLGGNQRRTSPAGHTGQVSQCFSTASAYRAFFVGQTEIAGARCLMKARAPGNFKFFVWLVLHGRCCTAERRKRHNLRDDDTCALCSQQSESITHLLLNCPFARECRFLVLRRMHWHTLTPDGHCLDLADWWTASRKSLAKAERTRGWFGTSATEGPLMDVHRQWANLCLH